MNTVYNIDNFSENATASARFYHFLMTGLGSSLSPGLTTSATDLLFSTGITFIEITFDGRTRTYMDLGVCQFTEASTTQLWYLDAGLKHGDYLSIGLLGNGSGSYSFGADGPERTGISIVTHGIEHAIYSSSHAHSNSFQTQGRVDIELSDCSRLARLTFAGAVIPIDKTNCQRQALPISGRLCLAC